MDEAFLVEAETDVVAPATTPIAAAEADLQELGVTVDAEEPLEVQVGDKVTYMNLAQEQETTVTIGTRTDMPQGMIDYRTPLAEALLGLQQGEIALLEVPGRPSNRLRILKIERTRETAGA